MDKASQMISAVLDKLEKVASENKMLAMIACIQGTSWHTAMHEELTIAGMGDGNPLPEIFC
jgi:hypothetical protein